MFELVFSFRKAFAASNELVFEKRRSNETSQLENSEFVFKFRTPKVCFYHEELAGALDDNVCKAF